ncbi:MAG: P1 family peptidase [Pseudomonadales bacterium]|nr:P1 family peptidase [Pseudomonadales bacterium]
MLGAEGVRARDLGIVIGAFPPGEHNAITDVGGVRVGHETVIRGESIRSGVTAIIPAPGNLYTHPVPAALHVGNGYGKVTGSTQIRELGEIETPILLTCTLCVWRAADALKEWVYEQPGMGEHTVNPVVGETNDARLNDMWANPIGRDEVFAALAAATSGPVMEGSVGAGTGTQAFSYKGGIGTSSRVLPEALGGWRIGVLVQTNFGGYLTIAGVPVWRALDRDPFEGALEVDQDRDDGSIMIVVATDAPLTVRGLDRVAARAIMGLARTGSYAGNGSGDYVIAFSTHPETRLPRSARRPLSRPVLGSEATSPLFAAAAEATEEAILNALFAATTVSSTRGRLEALPRDAVLEVLRSHGALQGVQ